MTIARMEWLRPLRSGVCGICLCCAFAANAHAVVKILDGFGDADRNNNGLVEFYDTDLNDSGTWNDATADAALAARNITEVTAATDPTDVGIIWSGIRSFDTANNLAKSKLRIINDSVPTGSETAAEIHNHGLALGVESRGGGSSFIGKFGQAVEVGPVVGDKLVVSVDWRAWKEANTAFTPPDFNEFRWGLYQDTDNELGMTAPYGDGFVSQPPGATVQWGKDDGNWFASQPGAEGDKGIRAQLSFGALAAATDARIQWEYNQAGINGTSNNGRILEGNGVSDTPATGGDTGTIASPLTAGEGNGGIIQGGTFAPHKLSMEIVRLADGLIQVASFVDNVEILRDAIKTTDTGFNILGPPPFSYNYVAFRASTDYDYVIDNFKVEVFGSNAGLAGDYNNNGKVDAADYVLWRNGGPLANEVADVGTISANDFTEWRARFGNPPGAGAGVASSVVPEPHAGMLFLAAGWSACGTWRRRLRK